MPLKINYNQYDHETGEFDCYNRSFSDGEAVHSLAVFQGSEFTDDELDSLNNRLVGRRYGGPGRWFCHGWRWYRQNNRIVARCQSGLDI